jgi:uncharacterized protein (DUF952 family)
VGRGRRRGRIRIRRADADADADAEADTDSATATATPHRHRHLFYYPAEMTPKPRWLYHVLNASEAFFDSYAPASFAKEKFIHASFQPDVLESARHFFPAGAALNVLQIDPRRVPYEIVDTDRGPMPHISKRIPGTAIAARFPLDAIVRAPDDLVPIRTTIDLPVTAEGPLFARHVPFGDGREVIVRRGRELGTTNGLPSPQNPVIIAGIRVPVVRYLTILSPPVLAPGAKPMSPEAAADYKPEYDVFFLPDADLTVRRGRPKGFNDAEVARILAAIRFETPS